ncbi:hypothetical protein F5146DRAFT_1146018 [Armillaria mellea]|nr:hypothetical protein F5146DRAFT_1146018 [Armillaria mellea]
MENRTGTTTLQQFALGAATARCGKIARKGDWRYIHIDGRTSFLSFDCQGKEYPIRLCKAASNFNSRARTLDRNAGRGQISLKLPVSPITAPRLCLFPLQLRHQNSHSLRRNLPNPHQLKSLAINLLIDKLVNVLKHFHVQDGLDLFRHLQDAQSRTRGAKLVAGIASPWNSSTRESIKTFPYNVQQSMAVNVVGILVYGKALKAIQKTHE